MYHSENKEAAEKRRKCEDKSAQIDETWKSKIQLFIMEQISLR